MDFTRGTGQLIRWCATVVACVLTGCSGGHSRFISHLHRGQEYLSSGNLDKAGVEFRNAAQIEPKNAEALYYNGRVAERRGNIKEAAGLYLGAIEAGPDFAPPRASLGKLYVFGAASQRALDTIAPGLQKFPDDADLLAVRAAARQQLKDEANALADAERAHELAPANENAVAVLASIYNLRGERDRAIAVVTDAVQRAPRSIDLHSVLANLYLAAGQADKAEEQMRRIIELEPHDMAPRKQFAAHLLRAHKVEEAQAVLERAVQDFQQGRDAPKADAAKLQLVEFVSTQRSREQGEKILRSYIAQDPRDLDLRLGLGALLQRTGAAEQAISTYQDVIERDGTGPRGLIARNRIAALRVNQGQIAPARKLIDEVLSKSPRDTDALILRAQIELQTNDPSGAIGDLRAVLRDQPGSVLLQRALAKAYMRKGEVALAEEVLRTAVQALPDDVPTRVELAEHLIQSGHADQASTLLAEGVRRTPRSEPLRAALVKSYLAKRDLPAARQAAEELKVSHADSPLGPYLAGLVAFQQGHLDESLKELEHALALKPDSIEPLIALVQVDHARGKPAAALARVQAAVAHAPANAQINNLLGEVYLSAKDFRNALPAFNRASSLNPGWWVPYRNLAVTHQGLAEPPEAIKSYESALKAAPLEASLVVEAASYLEKQRRIEAAIAAYQALYAANSEAQQIAANNLAMLLATYRTDRASLDQARDLTNSFASSENGSLLDTHGWVRFKRGEYRDALTVLERASARAPDSKVIRYHLGMAELRLGMTDRARTHLEAAVAGSADFSGSDEARSVLAGLPAKSG